MNEQTGSGNDVDDRENFVAALIVRIETLESELAAAKVTLTKIVSKLKATGWEL